nr:unnamed protein product [Callosobruchus chinensis]
MKSDHNATQNGFQAILDFYDQGKREKFVADVPLKKKGGSYFQVTPTGLGMFLQCTRNFIFSANLGSLKY